MEKVDDGRILEIVPQPDKYLSCNICKHPKTKGKYSELCFGKDNSTITIRLCDRCLNDFAEVLWKYLEEE